MSVDFIVRFISITGHWITDANNSVLAFDRAFVISIMYASILFWFFVVALLLYYFVKLLHKIFILTILKKLKHGHHNCKN